MKRITFALLAAAVLAAPAFALDDTKAKADVAKATATTPAPAAAAKPAAAAPAAAAPAAKPAAAAAAPAPAKPPMDINSVTAKQLATLDGIGEARSAAIVKGRPYKGKDELVEKKIIPQDVYDKIKDQIIAKQKPSKEAPKKP